MEIETLDYLGYLLNYTIFIYIFVKIINTSCLNLSDMSLSVFGLVVSLFIFIVNLANRRNLNDA
ncbi:MAG: hypothetical protein ABH840_00655 [Nanoarchaeota archaeon]